MVQFNNEVLRQDQNHISYLEQNVQFLVNQIQHLQSLASQPLLIQQPPPSPNLNLPQPPPFFGTPGELPLF